MLHRLSSGFFMLAILIYLAKYIKFLKINKSVLLKSHIIVGLVSCISMIIYSLLDFFKEGEATILLFVPVMTLIIITGTSKVRKKYKFAHLISVMMFALTLAIHIMS